MRALVAESNPTLRDQVVVGLEMIGGIEIETAERDHTIDLLTKKNYDFLVFGLVATSKESFELLDTLQLLEEAPQIIVLAPEAAAKKVSINRQGSRLFSTVRVPIEPLEFYKTLSRLLRRLTPKDKSED